MNLTNYIKNNKSVVIIIAILAVVVIVLWIILSAKIKEASLLSALQETNEISVDGETIKINDNREIYLTGVKIPPNVSTNPKDICIREKAINKIKEMLEGKTLTLEKDPLTKENNFILINILEKPEYVYVYLEDGTFVNKWLIENGYAYENSEKVKYSQQEQFKEAEKTARENRLGLWNDNFCKITNNKI